MRELSKNLERAKEHIEENVNRTKQSSSEKELRVLQLEQDLERIKTMATKQENRVDELEKQHQVGEFTIYEHVSVSSRDKHFHVPCHITQRTHLTSSFTIPKTQPKYNPKHIGGPYPDTRAQREHRLG